MSSIKDWTKIKEELSVLLLKGGNSDLCRHFLNAARVVQKALDDEPESKRTEILASSFGDVIARSGGMAGNITLRNWYDLCARVVKNLLCESKEKALYMCFVNLLAKTTPKYIRNLGSLREFFPRPHLLAEKLGLLDWDIPESTHQAASRAKSYYGEIHAFMSAEAQRLDSKPDLLGAAAKLAQTALETLERLEHSGVFEPQSQKIFDGTILSKRYTNRQEAALCLYDSLSDQEDEVRWVKWTEWAYGDHYGALDHRTRAQQQTVVTAYMCNALDNSNVSIPSLSGVYCKNPNMRFGRKIPKARNQNGLLNRLCEITGDDPEHYKEYKEQLEQFLFDNVQVQGLRVFKELSRGPLKIIIEQGQESIMRRLVLELYTVMQSMYKTMTFVDVDYLNYLVVPRLKASDSPHTILKQIVCNWIKHVNYDQKRVDDARAEKIFLVDQENTETLLVMIKKTLGSYPLLNLYTQLAQGIAQSLSYVWFSGIQREIMATFGMSSGVEVWTSCLQTLFLETVFYNYAIRKGIAFPEELLLDAAHIHENLSYAVVRKSTIPGEKRQTLNEMKLELENAISNVGDAIEQGKLFKPNAKLVDIPATLNVSKRREVRDLLTKYNVAISNYLRSGPNSKVYDIIFDNKNDAADIQFKITEILPEALRIFEINTQMEVIPLLRLTNKTHMEKLIIEVITSIRCNGGIQTVERHGNHINTSTFLLLCILRRYETLFPHEPTSYNLQVLKGKKERFTKALEQAKEKGDAFAAQLREPVASWWNGVSKSVLDPNSVMPKSWDQEAILGRWTGSPADLVYIITLRNNFDAIEQSLSEWFLAWLGKAIHKNTTTEETPERDAELEEMVRDVFPNPSKTMEAVKKISLVFQPYLIKLRDIVGKIRRNEEFSQTDPDMVKIHKRLLEIAKLEFSDRDDSPRYKVLEWASRASKTYHCEEIKLVKSILPPDTVKLVDDIVNKTLWSDWRKTLFE